MKIIIRPFKAKTDSGLIYDSYPKGVFHGAIQPLAPSMKDEWMKHFFETMKYQLATSNVHVACTEDDPDTILGYSIVNGNTLHFVYVKMGFRRKGIGRLLTIGKFSRINTENLTKVGIRILKNHPHLIGEQNEREIRDTQ